MAPNLMWLEVLRLVVRHCLRVCLLVLIGSCIPTRGQTARIESKTAVSPGLHLWYEIKSDPEDSSNLIICATKWDPFANGPFGVVYASSDAGKTWQIVLEDRNSAWVTEHSCAFGAHHRAYFISDASKVIDGEPHHELGTTRLFCSTDGGRHWTESSRTGWADYTTSAASRESGELYTFFQATWIARDRGRGWGNDLGLLVFSADAKRVSGPFFSTNLRVLDYRGIYPSNAIALQSGAVVALYYAKRKTPMGWQIDLGSMRATESSKPGLEPIVISHPAEMVGRHCANFLDGSMSYDSSRNRLYVIYKDGCGDESRMMLTWSDDEGRTWAKSTALRREDRLQSQMDNPSLAVISSGELGLLWSEGTTSRSWFFSYIRDHQIVEPPLELVHSREGSVIDKDALWAWVYEPKDPPEGGATGSSSRSITLDIRNLGNQVWRANGLVPARDKLMAIWPTDSVRGMSLDFAILGGGASGSEEVSSRSGVAETDISDTVLILYGGNESLRGQYYDNATGTLKIYLTLANHGRGSIRAPVKLRVDDVSSRFGAISILNATNGLRGAGAIWDVSNSLTGDQIPAGSTTNPFCLSFHLQLSSKSTLSLSGANVLSLRVSVFAHAVDSSEPRSGSRP
jgi:hypothetical protein